MDKIQYFSSQFFFRLKTLQSSFHQICFIPTSQGTFWSSWQFRTLEITIIDAEIRFDTQNSRMRWNVEMQGFVFILGFIITSWIHLGLLWPEGLYLLLFYTISVRKMNSSGAAREVGRISNRRGCTFRNHVGGNTFWSQGDASDIIL